MNKNLIPITSRLFILVFLLLATSLSAQNLKVFILAGQSNMQGQGDIMPGDISGTLTQFMDDGGDEEFEGIRDANGDWSTRDDVWVRYDHENGDLLNDNLGINFGASENQIGPELGFGHVIGNNIDEQVLIIKTCWGGKNLAVDFRPPSSGGTVGPFYTQMISDINAAIDNIETEFPQYTGGDIEISGFCWFQGWNDGEEEAYLNEYEENLINLITDVRADLDVENLPFVVGLTGNGGNTIDQGDIWVQNLQTILVPAQISAAENSGLDNVAYTDTREFWPEPDESPEPDFVHHWRNNAESFLRIGTEMGMQMLDFLELAPTSGIFPASAYGFNFFNKEFVPDNNFGAGYSFYAAVWPLLEQYPGYDNFQAGMGTWVTPQESEGMPEDLGNSTRI